MINGLLVAVAIVVVLAAVAAVVLLRRRSRPASPVEAERPQTVGELVRQRGTVPEGASGDALFTPAEPWRATTGAPTPAGPTATPRPASDAEASTVEVPVPQSAAGPPPTGEAGDAPWRRAARMRGEEPGAGWDTAPIPVVPVAVEPQPAQAQPARSPSPPVRSATRPQPAPRRDADRAEARPVLHTAATSTTVSPKPAASTTAAPVVPRPATAEPVAPQPTAAPVAAGSTAAEPAEHAAEPAPAAATVTDLPPGGSHAAEPVAAPVVAERVTGPVLVDPARAARPTPTRRSGEPAASVWTLPEAVGAPDRNGSTPPAPDAADGPAGPSRPLSDPDLTPLMGIPIVRPLAAELPVPPAPRQGRTPVARADQPTAPRPAPAVPAAPAREPDDEVVSMLPTPGSAPPPPVRSGSAQPVWFRVVRRDGEPVAAAVVALLDDHGHEVDTTKTATDGGGELRAPHGGRFLMITSADGFQPRAALLTVEEQPVELALLLPRSASIAGTVRSEGRAVTGGRVVARQEGEVVDDLVTGRDGAYRFEDLAEGAYALSATDHRGHVVTQVTLSEGVALQVDLDLVYRQGAR